MQIKLGKLWEMDGVLISIPEKFADEYTPAGFYHFIEKDEDEALMLLAHGKLFYLSEYEDDFEVVVLDMDIKSRIDALIEAYTILNLQLIGDGWVVDKENGMGFNLKTYDERLKSYVNLRNTINNNEDTEE